MKENRIVFVDYLRVIACFLVMLVHASENFYAADASGLAGNVSMLANEQNRFWVAFYDGTLGRISVPLFMLASAFLLVPLKPGVGMGDFYKRRFKRVLPPMIAFMLLYTFLPLLWGQMTWEQSWEFCTPNVLCATFGAFLLFTCITKSQAPRWITSLSKFSFGMYLMHLFFLSNIAPIFVAGNQAKPLVPVWLAIPCIAVLTFLCCAITTKLISLMPGSKWVIG